MNVTKQQTIIVLLVLLIIAQCLPWLAEDVKAQFKPWIYVLLTAYDPNHLLKTGDAPIQTIPAKEENPHA